MAAPLVHKSQQSSIMACTDAALGWCLQSGLAVALQPRETVELVVSQGRIWATLDGPHAGPANDAGDLVLHAGERLILKAGQRVVIESWGAGASEPAFFIWNAPPISGVPARR